MKRIRSRIRFRILSSLDDSGGELDEILAFLSSLADRLVDAGIVVTAHVGDGIGSNAVANCSQLWLLVGERLGDALLEEFERALEGLGDGTEPVVVAYFKELPEGIVPDATVEVLKARLDELGRCRFTFAHPDAVKLAMVMELSKHPELHRELSFRDGRARLGDADVLPLDNVPLYAGNAEAAELRDELGRLDAAHAEAVAKYGSDGPAALMERVDPIVRERSELSGRLHAVEGRLLDLYKCVHAGAPTSIARVRRASELLEEGHCGFAFVVLDGDGRERDLGRAEMHIYLGRRLADKQESIAEEKTEAGLRELTEYIDGERLRISVLLADPAGSGNAGEVDDSYGRLCKIAIRRRTGLDVLLDYARQLLVKHRLSEAVALTEERQFHQMPYEPPNQRISAMFHMLGLAYCDEGRLKEAESLFRKSYDLQPDHDLCTCEPDVAESAGDLAPLLDFPYSTYELSSAENLYGLALEIYRAWAHRDPDTFLPNSATAACNLANALNERERVGEAWSYYQEALDIRRGLAERDPDTFLPSVAECASALAGVLHYLGHLDEAEPLYREALGIYCELSKRDPRGFLPNLAMVEINLSMLLQKLHRQGEAEPLLQEAEDIRRLLPDENVDGDDVNRRRFR